MDGRPDKYKRLPGRGPRQGGFISVSFSRCSLYLGGDHLLAVESNGFSEDYKRFFFSDIQAIITRKTKRGTLSSIALALMMACSLAGALLQEGAPASIFFWISSAALFVALLVNILRGPTCICHIMTAVQEDQLPSLNRLRVARRVIGSLRQSIEKVQGAFSPEETHIDQGEGIAPSAPSTRRLRRPQTQERQIRHDSGTLHLLAFAFLLLDGIVTGIGLLHHTRALTAVSSVLTLIYSLGIVVALIKQLGSDIPGTVRKVTWASLGFVCVSYFLSYILMMVALFYKPPKEVEALTQWDMYQAMLDLSPQSSPVVMAVYIFAAACSLLLGALGLLAVKRHRDQSARRPRPDQNRGGERPG
jgi:hypothetical protein